jgi:hypothetical protein
MDEVIKYEYEYETPRILVTYEAGEILAEAETSSVVIGVS